MTAQPFFDHLSRMLAGIEAEGLTKRERELAGPQGARILVRTPKGDRRMLNLCANNYLGLANHPDVADAARAAIDTHGFGMASVRFICGTQTLHRALERRIASYLSKDDAILFAACFDANGALFETLLDAEDAVISDALNHASIIDGVRLSKAQRYRFANGDMDELESCLKRARSEGVRHILIATDGVFSMDGHIANLPAICELAERHDAIVMADDCHATGHLGEAGRGTPTLTGAGNGVHIVSGTLGKSLGGAMGGFIAAPQPVIDLLRQRARPYLFSNSIAPPVAAGSLKAIEIAEKADDLRARLYDNAKRFRAGLTHAGFDIIPGETPIAPVMLDDPRLTEALVKALDERGVYVAGFSFPVVPHGKARIRTQMSAALGADDVDYAISAFIDAGKSLRLI